MILVVFLLTLGHMNYESRVLPSTRW